MEGAHQHGTDVPDADVIQWLQAGCAECFSLLFHRYRALVYSIAWRVLRDHAEAEDVMQDIFLSIYLKRRVYDSERAEVRVWILHDVHFRALSRRRQLKGSLMDPLDGGHGERGPAETLQAPLPDADSLRVIRQELARLPERQRQVIELVHFEGCTLLESSKLLGESLANTRNLYYRGMKALRASLAPVQSRSLSADGSAPKKHRPLQVKTPVLEH